ncbi:MAG: dihydrofolate reductase [Clostridiales bacterium]|nr:dihydrofolate reductase [Clostridiales bacterium]
MLSMIVAVAKNNVIGKDNKLIWHLPEDLKRFKNITTGKKIIMGRKTFESLGRVLPNRKHIILCNDAEMSIDDENVEILDDLKLLDKYIESDEECFVIGGATIYKLLMPFSNKLYITHINQEFEGDVYFPIIDDNEWKVVEKEKGITNEENPYDYEYVTYIRK